MINWLQNWYINACNGNWEHIYGITIKTLDNPGWDLTIDLEDTGFEIQSIPWKFVEIAEHDWYGYKVTENVFNAAGDPSKLEFLIGIFKELIENSNRVP